MRSQKLLIVSATMLACTSVAGVSFADDTKAPALPSSATTPSTATAPTSTTTTTSADDVSASSPMTAGSLSPPPSGESTVVYSKHTPNKAVLITGVSLFASTYVTTAVVAGVNGPVEDRNLYIPIVGPWINLAERTPSTRENNERDALLIAGSGVLQGMGALMALTSFFIPEKVPAARIQAGNVNLQIIPQAGAGGGGLGAIGTF